VESAIADRSAHRPLRSSGVSATPTVRWRTLHPTPGADGPAGNRPRARRALPPACR